MFFHGADRDSVARRHGLDGRACEAGGEDDYSSSRRQIVENSLGGLPLFTRQQDSQWREIVARMLVIGQFAMQAGTSAHRASASVDHYGLRDLEQVLLRK